MVLYGCRIAMGFLQAFCSVYGPVWINEFAPPDRNTFWMGVLQANSAIGYLSLDALTEISRKGSWWDM